MLTEATIMEHIGILHEASPGLAIDVMDLLNVTAEKSGSESVRAACREEIRLEEMRRGDGDNRE